MTLSMFGAYIQLILLFGTFAFFIRRAILQTRRMRADLKTKENESYIFVYGLKFFRKSI